MKRPFRVFFLVIIVLAVVGGIGILFLPPQDSLYEQSQKLESTISSLRSGRDRMKELLVKRILECDEYRFRVRGVLLKCGESPEKLTLEFQTGQLSAEHTKNPAITTAFQIWNAWSAAEVDRASLQKKYDEINVGITSLETALARLKREEENAELQKGSFDFATMDRLIAESEIGTQAGLRPEDLIDRPAVQKKMSSAVHAFSALALPAWQEKRPEDLPAFPEYKFSTKQETLVQARLVTELTAIVENAKKQVAPLLQSGKGETAFLAWKDAVADQIRILTAFTGGNESDRKWKELKLSELRKTGQETELRRIAPRLALFYNLTDQLKKSDGSWDNLLLLLDELKELYPLNTLRANDKKFDRTVVELSQLLVLVRNLNEVETRVLRDHFCHLFDLPFLGDAGERKILTIKGMEYAFRWCPPDSTASVQGFWILESEITQEKWTSVMGSNPSYFREYRRHGFFRRFARRFRSNPEINPARRPVEQVSWSDVQTFCEKLSAAAEQKFSPPTETEWEYAALSGSTGPYSGSGPLSDLGWYRKNSNGMTSEVEKKTPNAWGLYDMSGNVQEWCLAEKSEGSESKSGSFQVLRGGSWNSSEDECQSTFRLQLNPNFRINEAGFRIVTRSLGQ